MLKGRPLLVFSVFFFCALPASAVAQAQVPAWGQAPSDAEKLFSPSVGQKFYEIAYELANSPDTSSSEAEQAIIFLTATTNLDTRANYVLPDMIKLVSRYPSAASILPAPLRSPAQAATGTHLPNETAADRSQTLYNLIRQYVDESADLEVTEEGVRYMLEQLDSREQREKLLEDLLTNMGGKNARLDSQLHTLLGLLMTEKADFETAQSHLMHAYNGNKYNRLAFAKLAELAPEQFEPVAYLEHLRLALAENALDIEAALAFAQYARSLELYETAADAYEYCAELFGYLYPSQALPAHIYLPWMISSYNTQRNQHRCLQIADQLRQSGRFDLVAQAIAGRAAAKIGDTERANWILRAAEDKAIELLDYQQTMDYELLAWFYCFASPDADKAIDWANKAYSIEPTSPTAAAVLAYSLVMNGQSDWARPIIDSYEHNQVAELTLAQIQLADGKRDLAIETLKSAIAKDPTTLEAEHAKEILARHGGEYIPPIDPDLTLIHLRNSFGQQVVPAFTPPEKIISVQLNVRGAKFSYGS
jgi:tetratricopeptide (TPR) repeat protein